MTKAKEKKPPATSQAAPLTPAHTPSNSAAPSANNSPFRQGPSLSPLKKSKKDLKGKKRNNAGPITPPEPTATVQHHINGREADYGHGSDEEPVEKPAKKAMEKHAKYKYTTEIQQMMFVFGEVADPLPETLMLIEDIVRSQVIEIIIQGAAQAQRRGSRHMNAEDLIFLIRHDRAKCNRLRTYLSWKDVRKNVKEASKSNDVGADEIMEAEDILGDPNADKPVKSRKKTIKLSWDLIGCYSDGLNDDEEDDDDETEVYKDTIQRLKDADEITRKMTREEYVHYSECRQASFTYRKAKRFREWANMATYVDMKPNDDIIDILGFLTFEMVNTLTEMGLATKREEEEYTGNRKRTRDESEHGGKGNDTSDGEEVVGSYCDGFPGSTKKQRDIQYESIFAPVPTGEMTANSLFSAPPQGQTPLQPCHLQEAFRRLQKQKQTAGNNFRGGLRRTKLGLI